MDATVDKIYEAAADPSLWDNILKRINDEISGGCVRLVSQDISGDCEGLVLNMGMQMHPERQSEYVNKYMAKDLRLPYIRAGAIGDILLSDQILNDREKTLNCEVENFRLKWKAGHIVHSNLSFSNYHVHISAETKDLSLKFGRNDLTRFKSYLPHIRRSLRLQFTLQSMKWKNEGLGYTWDNYGRAVFLIDKRGKILFSNKTAEQLIRRKIVLSDSCLAFADQSVNLEYVKCLHSIAPNNFIKGQWKDAFLITDEKGNQFGARFLPYAGEEAELKGLTKGAHFIIISPLSGQSSSYKKELHTIGMLYDLNDGEKTAIEILLRGDLRSLDEPGYENTSGTLELDRILTSAMKKIGVRGKTELIRLLERFCFLYLN